MDVRTPYAWPQLLHRADPDTKVVYLDLLHWIGLAQAAVGHAQGRQWASVLSACREARRANAAVFPLSSTHYIEMLGIRDPSQRRDVAKVMEELSGFAALPFRAVVFRLEIDEVLAVITGGSRLYTNSFLLLGYGVAWAHGIRLTRTIRPSSREDVTAEVRGQWASGPGVYGATLAGEFLELERSVLRGPSDEERDELQSLGYQPERVQAAAERRAEQEREQADRLDAEPRWRRGRLRDLVSARELLIELNAALAEALSRRGMTLADLGQTVQARQFIDRMPSTDVAVTLKTAAHRNPDKGWDVNDVHDIDALSVAVPYCDIVVTEKHAHHVLTTAAVPERARTRVLRRLVDLPPLL